MSTISAALDLGADDYLTKPFGTAELLARVRTAIRHTRTTSANSEIAREGTYTVGEMTIDYNKHQVLVRGENVHLTLSEFRIVALLGKFAGKVLTYDYIIKELWGPRAGGDNQILRVNMANIRRKIGKKSCRTGVPVYRGRRGISYGREFRTITRYAVYERHADDLQRQDEVIPPYNLNLFIPTKKPESNDSGFFI